LNNQRRNKKSDFDSIIRQVSKQELERATIIGNFSQQMGVDKSVVERFITLLNKGRLTFAPYQEAINRAMHEAQNLRMKDEFERMFNEAMNKRLQNA
jgi:hypothetical protein